MTILTRAARSVLDAGVLCHLAAVTSSGPHVTPLVFALAGDRLWITTSRGSTKARAWRDDDRVGGLVRDGDRAVTFTGRAATHDALDPSSWLRSAAEVPLVTLASARFTRKNARFFAGYAVDANRVPLAWSPPGRVFAELRIDRWALLDRNAVVETWGAWTDAPAPPSEAAPRRTRAAADPFRTLPSEVADAVGEAGDAVVALLTDDGPLVVPATWTRSTRAGVTARIAPDVAALAGRRVDGPVALEIDRPSAWRARDMVGAMARGAGHARSVRGWVELSIDVGRIVWWRGWQSGTVVAA